MTINQALKRKNKLALEIKNLYEILKTQNSLEESAPRRYSIKTTLDTINQKILELSKLKAKIHGANKPMYEQIFLIAELKGLAKQLKQMPTDEGKVSQRFGGSSESKTVEIDIASKNDIVSFLENSIDELQDTLDKYNAVTTIN